MAPEWISAVAAAGALVAAIVAGRTAWRLYRLEAGRDRIRQAAQVNAWVVVTLAADEGIDQAGVEIMNGSGAPVYDVCIAVADRDGVPQPPLTLAVLPPGRFFSAQGGEYHWELPDAAEVIDRPLRPVMRSAKWRVISLTFRDSGNVHWIRDESGRLREVL